MTRDPSHIEPDQLLLHASGELPEALRERISMHVASCSECSARLAKLESTLADFSKAHYSAHDSMLPSCAGPRALLKAQIENLTACEPASPQRSRSIFPRAGQSLLSWRAGMVLATLMIFALLWAGRTGQRIVRRNELQGPILLAEPNANLTPGAALVTTQNRVCSDTGEQSTDIPQALKAKVLQLYGVSTGLPDTYEVDYLITPELGGATDVRNLWPEPYDHTMWNAHVKDQLENRLRQMVCQGNLDLATAQHDISTDWIAAYRKYFHADAPVSHGSS